MHLEELCSLCSLPPPWLPNNNNSMISSMLNLKENYCAEGAFTSPYMATMPTPLWLAFRVDGSSKERICNMLDEKSPAGEKVSDV